jgi:Ribbon-helix-helix protein, copG family.
MVGGKINVSVWVSLEQAEGLREMAHAQKKNVSETLRSMIDEKIEPMGKKEVSDD